MSITRFDFVRGDIYVHIENPIDREVVKKLTLLSETARSGALCSALETFFLYLMQSW